MKIPSPHLEIFVVVFSVTATVLAGLGGLAPEGSGRILLGMGTIFCLLMMIVPAIFSASGRHSIESAKSAALGALCGICYGLFYRAPPANLLGAAVAGAALGFASYWASWFRYGWRH